MGAPFTALKDQNDVAAKIGGSVFGALHGHIKPLEYGALGHYRTTHRVALVATQAANSRLWEIRNPGTNLIIPTRMSVQWLATGAHTAAIEDSLDLYKVTGFSAVDTTNTTSPSASVIRGTMAAAPGSAIVRGLTAAGNAAGMTGGTLTKDTNSLYQLPQWFQATLSTTIVTPASRDFFAEDFGEHPIVLGANEGLILENRVLLGAAAASSVYIDFSWAEVTAF